MSEEPRPRASERRVADRRRVRRPATHEESWFGAFAPIEDTQLRDDDLRSPGDSAFASGFSGDGRSRPGATAGLNGADVDGAAPPSGDDSRFLARQAARLIETGQTGFERIYRVFIAARAALGVALLAAVMGGALFGLRPSSPALVVSSAYAALTFLMWLLPHVRPNAIVQPVNRLNGMQWGMTIGADLVCFTALHVLSPASNFNYVALLVLPVLMAGVLTPRRLALGTAAAVTLMLLGIAWLTGGRGSDSAQQLAQAALAGSGFFVITVLAGELAVRLAREESSARGSMEMARQQAQLNRLVIEEMQDGVLVVDRRGRVRAANPAARRLLAPNGLSRPAPFQLRGVEAWDALVKAVERAFVEATWPEAGRDVVLQFADLPGVPGAPAAAGARSRDVQRTLRVRVRFTRKREPQASEEYCVLFLEDVRNMQARSRQEKLAAMGRVSAGIAHEIRNPLAAISQANALLAEDATDPSQRKLMQMVSDNVERLKRIVDDVMEVAPSVAQEVGVIDATAQVAAACGEWARACGVSAGANGQLRVDLPPQPLGVLFDAEHLRRVLVNLLDNALRYASKSPGAIHLRLDSRHEAQAFLSVASDGPPIPADVEPYLFEPFFSTRSRGTGLGLYICRELCERYGATIDYRLRTDGEKERNEFFVEMRRRAL